MACSAVFTSKCCQTIFESACGMVILEAVLGLIEKMEKMQMIEIRMPFPIDFESSRGSGNESKSFKLNGTSLSDSWNRFDSVAMKQLLQDVKVFTGAELEKLTISSRSGFEVGVVKPEEVSNFEQLLQEIKKSENTLEKLDFYLDVAHVSDLALKSIANASRLSELTLSIESSTDEFIRITFPDRSVGSTLKKCDLVLKEVHPDWRSPSLLRLVWTWVGRADYYL